MANFADMKERIGIRKILETTGYVISCLLFSALLVIAVAVLVQTWNLDSPRGRFELHGFLGIGMIASFLLWLIPGTRSNLRWLMKFTHEFTHLVFALLFFRKIYRFKVDAEDSYVSYSNGWLGYHAITLSPYCVPLYALALLPWRYTSGTDQAFLAVIDIFIGLAYAFHICCWIRQTRLHQTDITGPGVILSLLIISTFQILNMCLIMLTPSSGVIQAITRVFWEFPSEFLTGILQSLKQ